MVKMIHIAVEELLLAFMVRFLSASDMDLEKLRGPRIQQSIIGTYVYSTVDGNTTKIIQFDEPSESEQLIEEL